MSVLAVNKKAGFDYKILETYEAGLVLSGPEVKSIKGGHISLKESYIDVLTVKQNHPQLYLLKAHVAPYRPAGKMDDYDPIKPRKLLLHQNEIIHLMSKKQQVGLTLIPLKIYTKNSFIKLEFALAQGKKKYDKRETIKKRDIERGLRILTKKR